MVNQLYNSDNQYSANLINTEENRNAGQYVME